MSEEFCKAIEKRLDLIEIRMSNLEGNNSQLIKIVVIGLLTIVGAVIGVKIV